MFQRLQSPTEENQSTREKTTSGQSNLTIQYNTIQHYFIKKAVRMQLEHS